MVFVRITVAALLSALVGTVAALGQTTSTAPARAADNGAAELKSLAVRTGPVTEEELRALLERVQAHIAYWQARPAATQPSTQPAPNGSDVLGPQLWSTLARFEEEVKRQLDDLAELKRLESPEEKERLKAVIQEYEEAGRIREKWGRFLSGKDETKEQKAAKEQALLAHVKHEGFDAEALTRKAEEADKAYTEANADIEAKAAAEKQRADEFTALQEESKSAPAQARAADEALKSYVSTLPADISPEKRVQDVRLAFLEAQAGLGVIRSAGLDLRQKRLAIEQVNQHREIDGLRKKVEGLRSEKIAYQQAKAAYELEAVKAKAQEALTPYERTYQEALELELQATKWYGNLESETKDRFSQTRRDWLETRTRNRIIYWEDVCETLKGGRVREIRQARQKVSQEMAEANSELRKLQALLQEAKAGRIEAQRYRGEVETQFDRLRQRFEQQARAAAAGDADRADDVVRVVGEWVKLRLRLTGPNSRMQQIMDLQNGVISLLEQAVAALERYITALDTARDELFWAAIRARDDGVLTSDWSALKEEWNEARKATVFPPAAVFHEARQQVLRTSTAHRVSAALVLIVSVGLVIVIRSRLRSWSDQKERRVYQEVREDRLEVVSLSDRVQIVGARTLAAAMILGLPFGAVLIAAVLLQLDEAPWGVVANLSRLAIVIWVGFAVVHGLFNPGRPRFRLMQCTNAVAAYWYRWTRRALWVALVAMPVPLFLRVTDTLPLTELVLWQIVLVVYLLLMLVFLSRRRHVLDVAGEPRPGELKVMRMVVATLYPFLPLGVLGLLGLVLSSRSALAAHVFVGALWSVLVLVLATLLSRSLRDLRRKYRAKMARCQERVEEDTGEAPLPADALPGRARAGAEAARRSAEAAPSSTDAAPRRQPSIEELEAVDRARDRDLIVAFVALAGRLAVAAAGAAIILCVWGISWLRLRQALGRPLIPSGREDSVTRWQALAALAAIAGTVWLARGVRSVLAARVYPLYRNLDEGGRASIDKLATYVVFAVGAGATLKVLEVDFATFAVLFGTLGLGLGLGLQPLFVNFLSGLMMMGERHVKVGDKVDVDGTLGVVTSISLRATTVRTFDNIDMVIPNSQFITGKVINWTLQNELIRGTVDVGVAYGSDVRLVRRLLEQVMLESPLVLRDPAPTVRFINFGASSLDFRVYAYFNNMNDRWEFVTDCRYRIVELFKQHGIEIPFPQRALSTRGDQPLKVAIVREGDAKTDHQ